MSKGVNEEAAAPVGNRRTGGRSARVRQAVLESALGELCASGYAGFSIANVARRAGVHETTIYRRWPQREDLIADATMEFADARLPVPDTGDLATDLRIVLNNIVALFESPVGQTLVALAFASRSVPEFGASTSTLWYARIRIGQRVFEQAIARGEWPPNYDQSEAFGELVGPLLARYFLLQEAIGPEIIEARIRAVIALGRRL